MIATAIALSASGLAIAGALPDPVQTVFSEAAGVIGLDIPAPIPVPPAVSTAPAREQTVAAPPVPEPQIVIPPESVPAPIVPVPNSAAVTPALPAPQPAAPIVPPAAPAQDLEAWLTELIRQALAAANAKAMNPQAEPIAGAGQQTGQSGWQNGTSDNPWHSYGRTDSQTKPSTYSPSSSGQYNYQQGMQSQPTTDTSNTN